MKRYTKVSLVYKSESQDFGKPVTDLIIDNVPVQLTNAKVSRNLDIVDRSQSVRFQIILNMSHLHENKVPDEILIDNRLYTVVEYTEYFNRMLVFI